MNRSVSISMASIELNSSTPSVVEQEHANHQWPNDDDGNEEKNKHLLKSGQLGICNDPYCTTCPTSYNYKGKLLTSRVPQGFMYMEV
ncbi:hypothetical protein L1987_32983 [Smallanthus sonchifolius]|uniref:Uncharacterized protein n=1 Tax=Smallanthus sonchifolius TaxID=185202 RepID=A0ACB9HRG9_9ASTR|nr:hypothetical protein L1987_32983 [Smallanthus sonchifolius]